MMGISVYGKAITKYKQESFQLIMLLKSNNRKNLLLILFSTQLTLYQSSLMFVILKVMLFMIIS